MFRILACVILLVAGYSVLIFGCTTEDLLTEGEKKTRDVRATRDWKMNDQGVPYFLTCVGNKEFIATNSRHSFIQLAGPIGDCND